MKNKNTNTKTFTLDENFDPQILKTLSYEELTLLSDQIRKRIIEQCAKFGGHLSSNLGTVELEISLYKCFNAPKDKILFDVGHQTYTQKILTGRPLTNLRQKDGCDGFQKRKESVYDCYECGHSSTSLSAAMGMAIARDLKKENYKVITVIGDSSFANGLSFEALNNLNSFHHQLLIVLNDNEMSISKPVGGMAKFLQGVETSNAYRKDKNRYVIFMQRTGIGRGILKITRKMKNLVKRVLLGVNDQKYFNILSYGPINGNDLKKLDKAFKKLSSVNRPVILHVKTTKGKGYSFAEKDETGLYHSTTPFNIESGEMEKTIPNDFIKFSTLYSSLLYGAMAKDNDLYCISPATAYGSGVSKILNKYHKRSIDVGISEEHAVVLANGLATDSTIHPYVFMYSSFLQRAYDEIIHDVCRMNNNVTFMIDHAGLTGNDGETHQGIYDSSFLFGIPNLTIAMAKDKQDAIDLFAFSITYKKPFAIRYPCSATLDTNTSDAKDIKYLEWRLLRKTNDDKKVCLLSFGPHLQGILKKTKDFKGLTIVNTLFIYPINKDELKKYLDYENIVIYNPYGIESGYVYQMENALIDLGYKGNVLKKSIPITYVDKGTILEQEQLYGVDEDSLVNLLKATLND
jgi:1-deoxy-D-xylulose-5-phosphate synthase